MGLELEALQKQTITQNMIQQITVLQMNVQELTDYIQKESMENPVLELENREPDPIDPHKLAHLEWIASRDEQNRTYSRQDLADKAQPDIFNIKQPDEETLAEHLMGQLIGKPYTKLQFRLFHYISQCLDDRGYFTDRLAEISEKFCVPLSFAENCLKIMKSLEPAGVCAETLAECLTLQLEREREEDLSVERAIARDHLALLGKNQLHVIAGLLGVPIERVKQAKRKIQSLNPTPSTGFSRREPIRTIFPDVSIRWEKDHFEILFHDERCPVIRMNRDYLRMLQTGSCDKQTRQYLMNKVHGVEMLQNCIERRRSTLLNLTAFLVESQRDYFLYGAGNLRPLRKKDAAQALQVHESTIGRAVDGKYLQCRWGLFPLEYFFSKGVALNAGGEEVATGQIKGELKRLIEGENKQKPLSDQKLAEKLAAGGFPISRRTVAKYRESMKIPDCRGRKEF